MSVETELRAIRSLLKQALKEYVKATEYRRATEAQYIAAQERRFRALEAALVGSVTRAAGGSPEDAAAALAAIDKATGAREDV